MTPSSAPRTATDTGERAATGIVGGIDGTNLARFASVKEVEQQGALIAFSLEFDCFTFPTHIGSHATIGPWPKQGPGARFGNDKHVALDLRRVFNINLAGIKRRGNDVDDEADEIEWFPDAFALARPGDLGLVSRCPNRDGSSA